MVEPQNDTMIWSAKPAIMATTIINFTPGKFFLTKRNTTKLNMAAVRILNTILRDRIITEEEILGLLKNHLVSSQPPLGKISFSDWLEQEGSSLCSHYINDYKRSFLPNLMKKSFIRRSNFIVYSDIFY
jgi:hypothetical protein